MINLILGDCLEKMKDIEDKSIDMILCDLPYGTTACKWDTIIPFEPLWKEYKRVAKDNAAIVLTASQPFTTALISSNMKDFRYCWVWDKTRGTNFATAKIQPMKCHEDVCVFYSKKTTYNPQYWFSKPYKTKAKERANPIEGLGGNLSYCPETISENGERYPLSIIQLKRDNSKVHPTQKPVTLMEYLIKTYTNEGDLVLDNCMGSGTTGVACKNLNRDFIGIEKDEYYFNIAKERIGCE